MKIDAVKTRERFKASGRKIATFAKSKGFDTPRLHHVISGNVVPTDEELKVLNDEGLLVWQDDEQNHAA